MDTRYFLRFETGDRQGERVPLDQGTHRLGRKSDNAVVIRHGSVSGHHAELVIEGSHVELVDLESTNGTKVEGQRIQRHGLLPGDTFLIGAIELRLMVEGAPDARASSPATDDEPFLENWEGGDLAATQVHVQAANLENLQRSGARSKAVGALLALVVVGAGGWLAWQKFGRGGGPAGRAPVPEVEGNVFVDGAFEGDGAAWDSGDQAPAAFARARAFAHTGAGGLGARLAAGEWALAESPSLELGAGRGVTLQATLEAVGAAEARFGLALEPGSPEGAPLYRWLPVQRADAGLSSVRLELMVPPGYPRGRVIVAGRGEGEVSLDDVALVIGPPPAAAERFNENELRTVGGMAAVVRSGRLLFSELSVDRWGPEGLQGGGQGAVRGTPGEKGFAFRVEGGEGTLWIRGGQGLALGAGNGVGLASVGPEGYRAHALPFERERATGLVLGEGIDQILVSFPRPVSMRGSLRGGDLQLVVGLGSVSTFELQMTFATERAEATRLAQEARAAEKAGQPGRAVGLWSQVLDRFPFEKALVGEAEEARARMVGAGLAELDTLRQELERARFFALSDLFEESRDRVDRLALAYRGTEVEAEAGRLRAEVESELESLGGARRRGSADVLRGVLQALDPSASPRLVEHLRGAVEALEADKDPN